MLAPGHRVDQQRPVEVVVAALAGGLGGEQAGVAGGAEQVAPVARVVVGAQRVGSAQPGSFEGLARSARRAGPAGPARPARRAFPRCPARRCTADRRPSARPRCGRRCARRCPAALYPHSSANSRISACAKVCSSTYRTPGQLAGRQPPVGAPLVVRGGQDPAARGHDLARSLSQAASRSSLNRRKIPSPRVCAQGTQVGASREMRHDPVAVGGQDVPFRGVDPGEAEQRGDLAQPRDQHHLRQPGADLRLAAAPSWW